MSDTCAGTKANGDPCGAQPMEGSDYCRHHRPDPDDSEKVVGPEGKSLAAHEEKAVGRLYELADGARTESVQRKASADLLAHIRWKRERDDE